MAAIIPLIIIPLYISLLRNSALKTQLSKTTDYDTLHELERGFKEIIARKPVQSLTYGRFSVFDFGSALGATFAGSAAMLLPIPSILKIAAALVGSSVLIIGFTKVPKDDSGSNLT